MSVSDAIEAGGVCVYSARQERGGGQSSIRWDEGVDNVQLGEMW